MSAQDSENLALKPGISWKQLESFKACALALFLLLFTQPVQAHESATHGAAAASAALEDSKPVNRPIKDKWAVVVGVSKFKDPKLNLDCPAKDAHDVYNYLVKKAHFKPDHIVLLTDEEATRQNVLSAIGDKWLPRVALPDDVVFLYFSSHGSPSSYDIGGVNYLLAYDTDPQNLYATGIGMNDIARIIRERVHTDRLILVLDACHSGSAKPGSKGITRTGNVDVNNIVHGSGQLVISSSEPKQRSWESMRYKGSVFTKYLIDGLELEGDKTTIGEAFDFMKDKVQAEVLRDRGVLQTPVMKAKWEGEELILASKPCRPREGFAFVPKSIQKTSPQVQVVTAQPCHRTCKNVHHQVHNQNSQVTPEQDRAKTKKIRKLFRRRTAKAAPSKTSFTVTIETGKHPTDKNPKVYVVMHGKNGANKKVFKIKCNVGDGTVAGAPTAEAGNCNHGAKSPELAELPQT